MKILILLVAAFLLGTSYPHLAFADSDLHSASATLTPLLNTPTNGFDTRVVALQNVFEKYHSPLANSAQDFVLFADKYGVDWKLLPAISGLESTFAQRYVKGSYNAYGWGGGYIYFKSWEDGIATINKTLREKYMDTWGAKTVWEIGPYYAESKTWAPRVNIFLTEIEVENQKLLAKTTLDL